MTKNVGSGGVVVCDLCGLPIGAAPESKAARLTLGCSGNAGVSFDVCRECEAILAASINSLFSEARNGRKS